MVRGVVHSNGRGVPECIMQEKVKSKEAVSKVRGTTHVAVLKGDPQCEGFVAVSIYDSKPIYLFSNACTSVVWLKKQLDVYHKDLGKKV